MKSKVKAADSGILPPATPPPALKTAKELEAERLQLASQIEEMAKKERSLRWQLDAVREQERQLQDNKVLQHIDALLDVFASSHCRTSCSDENLDYSYRGRCRRCLLLRAKQEQHVSFDMELVINAS